MVPRSVSGLFLASVGCYPVLKHQKGSFMNDIETKGAGTGRWSSLVELLRFRAAHSPDDTAFIFVSDTGESRQTLNYGELDRLARRIAVRIQADCRPGERALLLYPPGLDFISAFFGCLYAEVVAVPAYPPRDNRNAERMRALAEDVQASLLFSTAAQVSGIERRMPANGEAGSLPIIASDLLVDGEAEWRETFPDTDRLAFIQYTSGSSGNPKGVMVSHGNILHNEAVIQEAFGHSPRSLGVGWLPLFHDMGLIGNILQPLFVGFPIVLFSPVAFIQKPLMWLQLISQYRATTSGGPNFAYEHCVNRITDQQKAALDLSSWEVAFNGAEPIRAETLDRFADAFACCGFRKEAFYPCYGMAETTLLISGGQRQTLPRTAGLNDDGTRHAAGETSSAQAKVGCGFARFDQQILIVDPQALVPRPDGEVGEIWTSGPSVAQGYWNRPEESQRIFKAQLADGGKGSFLRTGDLGFMRDGELYITGRRKDLIIIRGRNYYPADIEQTVEASHPALKAVSGAAFSVEVEGEERLVIAQEVERSALRNLNAEEVTQAIRRTVSAQHELTVHAVLLLKTSSIPKTSSGKIQRHACKSGFLSGGLDIVGEWRQRVDASRLSSSLEEDDCQGARATERPGELSFAEGARGKRGAELNAFVIEFLQAEIARILGAGAGESLAQQPLNTLGLDSLMVIELTNKIHRETGFKVSLAEVMEGLTLQGLASAVQLHLDTNSGGRTASATVVSMKQATRLGLKGRAEISDPGQVLANLHNLSDAEVDAMLQAMAVAR